MRWWLYPALGVAAGAGYLVTVPETVSEAIFFATGISAIVAIVVGIHINQPASRTAWMLIAAGSGLWVLGDAAYLSELFTSETVFVISVADIIYLLGYPLLGAGLYLLVHQGGRRGELGHVANSTIVMIAFGLLMWVFVVQPETADMARTAGFVGVVYPAMDVFLLGLLVHFVGSSQWQSVSFRLLSAAVVATLVTDIAVDIESITAEANGAGAVGVGFLAFYVLAGTAALHPSMRTLTPPKPRGRNSRLTASFGTPTVLLLTAAVLTVPAVMAVLLVRGEDITQWGWGVVLCTTLLVVLVFVRVVELLGLLHRQTQTLRNVAETDHLTGLPNRHGLERWLYERTDEGQPLTVLLFDVDRFKDINNTFGHGVGDEVLREVGSRLREVVGERGAVGRVGADEFAVAVGADETDAMTLAHDMHAALLRPVDVRGATLVVEGSIGIACCSASAPETPPEELGRHAYLAMSSAKDRQPRIAMYDSSMDRDESGPLLMLGELANAIERGELEVYYQVQVGLTSMSVVGVEALLRWNHPEKGLVEPDSFLPMAERTALIRPLLEYVLVEALTQRQKWSRDGIDLTVSVNISARNLLDLGVVDQVRRALELACAPPEALIIEITETASVTDLPVAVESLDRLHRLGVVLAIDDYGTGYSSLAYMQRLPVQQLKIDRAFVTDMRTVDAHRIIVRSTIDLARTLGLTITAEGVEDRETLLDLKRLSCHCAQGYHLGRPVPALDIPESVAALNAELSNNAEVP